MSSEPIRQPLNGRLQPDRHNQAGQLTEEQRNFAKVVGQALAEAWGRQLRQSAEAESSSSRQR